MTNQEIARALFELADALEMTDFRDNIWKARAIRAGAQAIDALTESAVDLMRRGELKKVKGVGEGIIRRSSSTASSPSSRRCGRSCRGARSSSCVSRGSGRRRRVSGDLHMHTTETDGRSTLEEMVAAAAAAGREYIAITDHSQALKMVRGLDPARLRAQGEAIRRLNERDGRVRVLRGVEADILLDGSVDLGPEPLGELDWVIGSVHSHFHLPQAEQTRRIVKAIESGLIDALGHPTGRILEHRASRPTWPSSRTGSRSPAAAGWSRATSSTRSPSRSSSTV